MREYTFMLNFACIDIYGKKVETTSQNSLAMNDVTYIFLFHQSNTLFNSDGQDGYILVAVF